MKGLIPPYQEFFFKNKKQQKVYYLQINFDFHFKIFIKC